MLTCCILHRQKPKTPLTQSSIYTRSLKQLEQIDDACEFMLTLHSQMMSTFTQAKDRRRRVIFVLEWVYWNTVSYLCKWWECVHSMLTHAHTHTHIMLSGSHFQCFFSQSNHAKEYSLDQSCRSCPERTCWCDHVAINSRKSLQGAKCTCGADN